MEATVNHLTRNELEAGLESILNSPKDEGILEMIVARPAENQRSVLEDAKLDLKFGLEGDNWITRSSTRSGGGSAHPDMQINIMNSRVTQLVAQDKQRWALAGDQLYANFDLSEDNLPVGTQLSIGEAIIEVTDQPHTGCSKFVERFGLDAMKFVNSKEYRHLHLRGINARVVKPGRISVNDAIKKV